MSASTLERPPAHIDPRIRARRIEVRRGAGRRRLQRLVDVGLLLAVAAGFVVALRSPLLDVDVVRVEGNGHTPSRVVTEQAGISLGDQLMDIDLGAAGARVAALPWVAAVDLHRGIDGQVVIRLTERRPVAVAGAGTDAVLVDADGRVLGPVGDAPDAVADLVRLDDPGPVPAPGGFLGDAPGLALAEQLATVAPGLVQQLAAGPELTGVVDPGIEVRFGDATRLDAKVRSLETVLAEVELTCAATIDVRAPGSPVLTREEGCS